MNNKVPQHIAIIMDGNGRWAKQQGHERTFGHENGIESVRSVIEGAAHLGVKYLTLYAFSTENWNRPKAEIDMLMTLLIKAIDNELDQLITNHIRLKLTGRMSDLPEECQLHLQDAINRTSGNDGLTVVLALSYSGRTELTDTMRQLATQVAQGELTPSEITAETITNNLYHSEIPDPDILIRTGGDYRISNFLLWEIAYSELFFSPIMWPDFRKENLFEIVALFQQRERRFGKTSEQIQE